MLEGISNFLKRLETQRVLETVGEENRLSWGVVFDSKLTMRRINPSVSQSSVLLKDAGADPQPEPELTRMWRIPCSSQNIFLILGDFHKYLESL